MSLLKRLVINADDLGWSRGVSDGILLAHREGVVTSATLMVNRPASQYAVEQARNAPRLSVGTHVNLCEGAPVLPPERIPSLVTPEGTFHPRHELTRRLWRFQVSPSEIETEIRAQIQWMKAHGLTPTHADSHHNFHLHPRVAGAFRRALLGEGIRRARGALQRHWPRDGYIGGPHAGPGYRRLLVGAYMRLLQLWAFRDLSCPDCRLVVHPRYRNHPELLAEGWKAALESIPPGAYELECHPGSFDPGFSEKDNLRERRGLELRILTDPQFRALIERNGIQLVSYSEL